MSIDKDVSNEWWLPEEEGGFFGPHYMLGDNSRQGPFLDRPLTLEERTAREVNYVAEVLDLREGNRVLDCPCGYCRHTLALARRGVDMTGVDYNQSFLKEAAQKLREQKVDESLVHLVRADMRRLPEDLIDFDAVINMFTSFGFFPTKEEDMQVLREFNRVLKKGGRLLMHFDFNYYRIDKGEQRERRNRHLTDGSRLLVKESHPVDSEWIVGSWRIVKSGGQKQVYERKYRLRLYQPKELEEMLNACGFKNVSFMGDMDDVKKKLDAQSYETVVVAEKN